MRSTEKTFKKTRSPITELRQRWHAIIEHLGTESAVNTHDRIETIGAQAVVAGSVCLPLMTSTFPSHHEAPATNFTNKSH